MYALWPPLNVLEQELFSPSDALIQRWQRGEELPVDLKRALENDPEARARRAALETAASAADSVVVDEEAPVPPIPPDLQALIRRRVAARQARFSPMPTPGQIVRIDEARGPHGPLHWDLARPLAVLLNEPTDTPNVWYGWLVTPETDYAGYWDMLLGPEDEPCDPLARMVQLWNPVHLYLPSVSRVLAELRPERLAAVRALAVECLIAPEPDPAQAQPGSLVRRSAGSYRVRTGTPLSGPDDPRHRYQQLYHAYAEAVRAPARLASAARVPAPATRPIAALLQRWLAGAAPLTPAPRVAFAMSAQDDKDSEQDLLWEGLARITVHELAPDGAGRAQVSAVSELPVICEIRVAGVLEFKQTAQPHQAPVQIEWEADENATLTVSVADGRRLELPLVDAG